MEDRYSTLKIRIIFLIYLNKLMISNFYLNQIADFVRTSNIRRS